MKIEFSLLPFVVGAFLLYAGFDAIKTAETDGLMIQYTIQILLGAVFVLMPMQKQEEN